MRILRCDLPALEAMLPYPAADTDKYARGKLTVIGGSDAYPGSVCLASKAGLFAGAGYVMCACGPAAVPLVRAFAPSLVVRSWEGATADALGLAQVDERHPQGCLIGSGMAPDGGFQDALVEHMVEECAPPLVLDGGALRTVAERGLQEAVRARASRGRVTAITPHGGEAATLAQAAGLPGCARDATFEEKAAFASSLAHAHQAHVILKGPVSFIAAPGSDEVHLMDQGTPALAKAGTGDVLAGILGAFLAQGVKAGTACMLAAAMHAKAGAIATRDRGIISVTAEDVLEALPTSLRT